jgi:hypothetical protein
MLFIFLFLMISFISVNVKAGTNFSSLFSKSIALFISDLKLRLNIRKFGSNEHLLWLWEQSSCLEPLLTHFPFRIYRVKF